MTATAARGIRAGPSPVGVVVAGAIVAGIGLVAWQLSPAGHLLVHDTAAGGAGGHSAHGGPGDHGQPEGAALVAWFTVAWLLMTAATMLPTSLPLLAAFGRLLGDRSDGRRLVATVVGGYLAVWTGAGLVLSGADVGVHALMGGTILADHPGLVLAITLLVAGAYQLSNRSAQCLRACRSPLSFLAKHWTGRGTATGRAARVGLDYGVSCLGCCAALMVVMCAVGMASPLAMVGLGGVAGLHKLAPSGPVLAKATGVALVLAGTALGTAHLVGVR